MNCSLQTLFKFVPYFQKKLMIEEKKITILYDPSFIIIYEVLPTDVVIM